MKLVDIQTAIKEDSEINPDNLDGESIRIPFLHSKWYNHLIAEIRTLKSVERTFNKEKKNRTLYYLGKASDEEYIESPKPYNVLKQDLDMYLNADDIIVSLQERLSEQQIKVDLIEQFIKQVTQRSFNIKNAIEFLKFKNGVSY